MSGRCAGAVPSLLMPHPDSTSWMCTHYLHGLAPRGSTACVGRQLRLLSSVCPSASLFFFPSSQEAGPALESTLEEVGMAEMAAMRKQVRWG